MTISDVNANTVDD